MSWLGSPEDNPNREMNSVNYVHCVCGEAVWKNSKTCNNCGAEIMLSKDEVRTYQNLQVDQCSHCALEPAGGEFCAYIWCMGDIKMYPCDEFVNLHTPDMSEKYIAELREKVYKKSERYEREHKKPARRIEINDEM